MKPPASTRFWVLLALLYSTASLLVFNAVTRGRTAAHNLPAFTLPDNITPQLSATMPPDIPGQAVFDIPFETADMERTASYRLVLKSERGDLPSGVTLQVIAEGDHHLSFSHIFRLGRAPRRTFSFIVPLLDDPFFWRTPGHTGAWSPWERSGLRRLQVKLFSDAPLDHDTLALQYLAEPAAAATPSLTEAFAADTRVALGGRAEISFDIAGWHGNPFDCRNLPVTAEVTAPDGSVMRLTPFLHQEFVDINLPEGETIRPSGPKHFRVRHRPVSEGFHTFRLLLRRDGTDATNALEQASVAGGASLSPEDVVLKEGAFEVTAGKAPGFLRVSRRAPRFFERTADGAFVHLLGWNLPYPIDRPYGEDYVSYLPLEQSLAITRKQIDDIADCGGNFMNFWLSDWWNAIEWSAQVDNYGGIGRYNLKNAWINDQIVRHCEKRGVYMQWETLNHVRLSGQYGWRQHPYRRRNGGFLRRPDDFWTHPESIRWSENRLAYIVARYADSPAIHSWNIMSEPDMPAYYSWPIARDYLRSQTAFIAAIDPYGHVTSTHICLSDRDIPLYAEKPFQFINSNAYPGLAGLGKDQIDTVRDFARRFLGHDKPMLIAEVGGHWGADPSFKMRRDTIGALWAGIASGLAGSPLSWWWNFNYGEDLGRQRYRIAADFMRGEDLIAYDTSDDARWISRDTGITSAAGNARALGAGNGTRRFLFIYNFDTLSRTRLIPSICSDTRATFESMQPGTYLAEYWDIRRGRSDIVQVFEVGTNGLATLSPPDFTEAWAVKIRPRDAADGTVASSIAAGVPAGARVSATAPVTTEATGIAGTTVTAGSGSHAATAADWSWTLEPRIPIAHPAARGRSLLEARLALPDACRRLHPVVRDREGVVVPFAWSPLGGGSGWHLRIAADAFAGPLTVTAGTGAAPEAHSLDEERFGLEVTVVQGTRHPVNSREDFTRRYSSQKGERSCRAATIDQLENPLGDTDHFMATYQGPLLVPADGLYEFASNSDDASFVLIDGHEVVAWPGQHDMEIVNRPIANTWARRGQMQLTRGMHWVEYNHNQNGGGCLARLGWRLAVPAGGGTNAARPLLPAPYASDAAAAPGMEVVPEWALDGRIPCRVMVNFKGQARLAQEDGFGLELRRPQTRLATAYFHAPGRADTEGANDAGQDDGVQFRLFPGEGPQWFDTGTLQVPLWVWNGHVRRFSLEWEACVDAQRRDAVKVVLYDIALPLEVQFDGTGGTTKPLKPRQWTVWHPPAGTRKPQAFTIAAGGVPLARGTLDVGRNKP